MVSVLTSGHILEIGPGEHRMKIGPIVAEDDSWWCQVVGDSGHRWTIRVLSGEMVRYECRVNMTRLPGCWERDASDAAAGSSAGPSLVERIVAAGVTYIQDHYPGGRR